MSKITIVCVGKLKEKHFQDACKEYIKRLSRYCKLDILEQKDISIPDKAGKAILDKVISDECDMILSKIKPNDFVVVMDSRGENISSEKLADAIRVNRNQGKNMVFVIGGSLGLNDTIRKRANKMIAFGSATFPHQMVRMMLLEQIYRGYKIINNETYHK